MLVRLRQINRKAEKIAGTPDVASPGDALNPATDAALVIDPSFDEDKPPIDIDTGGESLSPTASLNGLETATVPYRMLARGSGNLTTPPEWDLEARASGMRRVALRYFEIESINTGGTYLHGETINFVGSGATGRIARDTVAVVDGKVFYELLTLTPLDTDNVVGVSSTVDCEIKLGLEAVTGGFVYRPDSIVSTSATHGGWSTNTPTKGDVIQKQSNPNVWGTVIEADGTSLSWEPEIGDFANGEVVVVVTANASPSANGSTATLSSEPEQNRGISITEELRQHGELRQAEGCRGNFSIGSATGEPVFIDFTAQGIQGIRTTKALGSQTTNTENVVQFRNGKYRVRDLTTSPATDLPFKIQNFLLATNNALAPDPDPEDAKGACSYRIGGREPQFTVDPRHVVPAIFDSYGKWAARTGVFHYIELPGAEGYRIAIEARNAHFTSITRGERDGQLVAQQTAKAVRVATAGDDEFAIFVT